jgi:Domain of unknown function (DUF4249)
MVYLLLIISLTACLDEYKLPVGQQTQRLVVESLLTNEDIRPFVTLSYTTQFGTATDTKPALGALVKITDSKGKVVIFRSVPNQPGKYQPTEPAFTGEPGNSYTMSVKLTDGREYVSPAERMPAAVPIENLTAKFDKVNNSGYHVFLDTRDPKNVENYYRWGGWGLYKRKSTGVPLSFSGICCDVCWIRQDVTGINLFADSNLDGNLVSGRPVYFSPFYYYGAHHIEIKQYAISRKTYQFWQRFQTQANREGSIFDPLPAPVAGNLANPNDPNDVALGYFEVSAVAKKRLTIPDELTNVVSYEKLLVAQGDCMRAYSFSVYDTFTPPGW